MKTTAFAIFFAVLVSATSADGLIGGYGLGGYGSLGGYGLGVYNQYSYPQYQFGYTVGDYLTGDNKQQTEVRSGPLVAGQYSIADPNGSFRYQRYGTTGLIGGNGGIWG